MKAGDRYVMTATIYNGLGGILLKGEEVEIISRFINANEVIIGTCTGKWHNFDYLLFSNNALPVNATILTQLPIGAYNNLTPGYDAIIKLENFHEQVASEIAHKKCECGAHSIGYDIHSTWCQLYSKEQV